MDAQQLLPQDVEKKGQEIYEKIKDELEAKYKDKYLTIDVVSGEYFVGDTVEDALIKAKEKYPGRIFHTVKVGALGIYSVSSATRNDGYNNWFSRQ